MTARSPIAESEGLGGFYVPRHEIRIAGQALPGGVLRDVIEVSYRDSIREIDSADIVVNNWDAEAGAFKFIGSETSADPDAGGDPLHHLFDPCEKTLDLSLGYGSDLTLMMTGVITTLEPSFSAAGPVLRVRALNQLHSLRRKQYSYAWEAMRDSDIARDLGQLEHPTLRNPTVRRFPVEIEIDPKARDAEPVNEHVVQRGQYDIDFLWNLARKRGYVVFLRPDGKLYFGPSSTAREPAVFELEWGKSLIDFNPKLTSANQIRSVTANYWDRRGKELRQVTVDLDTDPEIAALNADLNTMLERCDPREEQLVDEPFHTEDEARSAARDVLREQRKRVVEASGTTVGLPDLRAGAKAIVRKLGARVSGTYFIEATEHVLSDRGYLTTFRGRREEIEP